MSEDVYVKPNQKRDDMDLVRLAMGRLILVRCPGGRLTDKAYVCAHCGVDLVDAVTEDFCGQPVLEDGYTTFDATVAKRIMDESEMEFETWEQ